MPRRVRAGLRRYRYDAPLLVSEARTVRPHPASVVAAAWVLSIAFDLLLHGEILAGLYFEPAPFLLPTYEAFRRIPIRYLAFLIATIAVFWLLRRLDVRGAAVGARVAAVIGGTAWAAFSFGLFSITIAPPGFWCRGGSARRSNWRWRARSSAPHSAEPLSARSGCQSSPWFCGGMRARAG